MTMKKKIVIVALVVCIFAMSIASATLAYFTDTEGATNTFTIGNVDITLSEIDPSTNPAELKVIDGTTLTGFTYENVYPTQSILKNVTINNVATDAAYVAGIIEISGINSLLVTENDADATADAVTDFLDGGVLNDAAKATNKIVVKNDKIYVYVIATAALTSADTDSVVLFENVVIPGAWDNAAMKVFEDCEINVTAYATQTAGFTTAAEAIEGAFGDVFADYFA